MRNKIFVPRGAICDNDDIDKIMMMMVTFMMSNDDTGRFDYNKT